ncbi:O-antigen ligase family protein [Stutzerimonas frequens]|uniref:O-antigen ligase family protein n=1 Tax=Stutzerimonas frequens TaxID=2968969 RepID=UPI00190C15EC|nr:hypothetical protein [Stutzerimonas frequens]MBK3872127.1 hypothetical protein [Stutzerimonas frequens]MBK3910658.1 hypothetical protein [Stutzerimonas frequens]MBK3929919.1 hypothetical protein [Stutzerimonas frequens]
MLAVFCYALLFPGYFAFHLLVFSIQVPYFGWFTGLSIVSASILLPGYFRKINGHGYTTKETLTHFAVFIFFGSCFIAAAINHILAKSDYVSTSGAAWTISSLATMAALYLAGYLLPSRIATRQLLVFFALFSIQVAAVLYFFDPNLGRMEMPFYADGNMINYQGAARSIFFTGIIIVAAISNRSLSLALMAIIIGSLYFTGSRTELFLAIAALSIWVLLNLTRNILVISMSAALVLIPAAYFLKDKIGDRIVPNLSQDASLTMRGEFLYKGLEGIYKSPIYGDYMGQVRDFGETGAYIHNALSVWQQFGIMPFLIYISLCTFSVIYATKAVLSGERSTTAKLLMYVSLISIVAVVFTKSITWPIPALAWGLACSLMRERRIARRSDHLASVSPQQPKFPATQRLYKPRTQPQSQGR